MGLDGKYPNNNYVVLADAACDNPEILAPEKPLKFAGKNTQMREEDYKLLSLPDGRAKCLECGKMYTTVDNARHHFRKLHGLDPPVRIQCTICGSCFPHATHFRVHINRSHKIVGVKNIVGTYGLFVDPSTCLAHS